MNMISLLAPNYAFLAMRTVSLMLFAVLAPHGIERCVCCVFNNSSVEF
ncbi:hypothetical protein NC652_036665 [Populus alba x Populus x berolinensis]|nr:hypothetical protein NC652_036665 [Populus alba x Populus x berolinensis]